MATSEFNAYMAELYQSFQAHDADQNDRLLRYRNIEPESAYYLSMLVRIQQPERLLEIGTSTGYSTLWLAEAARATGAKLVTLEIEKERSQQAQWHAQKMGLTDVIRFWVGDALEFLRHTQEQYDFILLDAERDAYIIYWPYLKKVLTPKGVLIVDNVISHADQVKDFISLLQQEQDMMLTTLDLGAGILMATQT